MLELLHIKQAQLTSNQQLLQAIENTILSMELACVQPVRAQWNYLMKLPWLRTEQYKSAGSDVKLTALFQNQVFRKGFHLPWAVQVFTLYVMTPQFIELPEKLMNYPKLCKLPQPNITCAWFLVMPKNKLLWRTGDWIDTIRTWWDLMSLRICAESLNTDLTGLIKADT